VQGNHFKAAPLMHDGGASCGKKIAPGSQSIIQRLIDLLGDTKDTSANLPVRSLRDGTSTMTVNNKPAILVIDMVKDYFDPRRNLKITPYAKAIVNPIKDLATTFRKNGWPVVFATDAFREDDFIFSARMEPESIEGTEGAEVIDELERQPGDLWFPKPRFSAFFQTGLAEYLREREVRICAVTGIATPVCVLTTALDAICYDFRSVIVSDCSAAASDKIHKDALNLYGRTALYPLLKVSSASELLSDLGVD
jgi:nicotinamidase/pyrazinamidase